MPSQARKFETLVALKKETTWGTGVAPDVVIPLANVQSKAQITEWFDDSLRGLPAMDFDALQEAGHGELSMDVVAYPDRIGYLLMAIFGTDGVTGSGDPYTHAFTPAVTPPSFTIEDQYITGSNGGLRFTGARCGSLNFSWDGKTGVLAAQSQWMSKIPSKVTAVNPSLGTVGQAIPGWKCSVTATGLTGKTEKGAINITRELEVVHTDGATQDPYIINVGPMRIEGQFTVVTADLTDFDRFLADTKESISLAFVSAVSNRSITFLCTNASLNVQPWEGDRGALGVRSTVAFRGLYNATDGGPGKVTLVNGVAAY